MDDAMRGKFSASAPACNGVMVVFAMLIALVPLGFARAQIFLPLGGESGGAMLAGIGLRDDPAPPEPDTVPVLVGDLGSNEIDLPGLGTIDAFARNLNLREPPQDPTPVSGPPAAPVRFTDSHYYDFCSDHPDDSICDDFWFYYKATASSPVWGLGTGFSEWMFPPVGAKWVIPEWEVLIPEPEFSVPVPNAVPNAAAIEKMVQQWQADVDHPFIRFATHPYALGNYDVPLQDVPHDIGHAPTLGTDTPQPTTIQHGLNKWTPSVEEEYKRSLLNDAKTDTKTDAKTDIKTLGANSDQPISHATGFAGRQELLEQTKTSVTNTAVEHGQVNPVTRDSLLENAKTETAKTGFGEKTDLHESSGENSGKSGFGDQHASPRLEQHTLSKSDEGIHNNRMPTLNEHEQQTRPFGSEKSPVLGGGASGLSGHSTGPSPGGFGGGPSGMAGHGMGGALGGGMHPSGGGAFKGGSTLRKE